MKTSCLLVMAFCAAFTVNAQTRWQIQDDGSITWNIKPGEAHEDNIEMAGKKVAVIVTYGVDTNSALSLDEFMIFPTFRTVPQNTRSHISTHFNNDTEPKILINGTETKSSVMQVSHKGIMQINGRADDTVHWTRKIFPSADKPAAIETISFTNVSIVTKGDGIVTVELQDTPKIVRAGVTNGLDGPYEMSARVLDAGKRTLKPGESTTFVRVFSARREAEPEVKVDAKEELQNRAALVQSYMEKLQLETPDKVLNTMFAFSKIRAAESIYLTKGGLMHGPGGGRYYAAIWANDQAEYANPFFAYLGDPTAAESATNAYRLFAKYMNPDHKPIPSSIVAEGTDNWHGAGDRGDMAMISYGASRFALAYGNKKTAEQLWPLIEWCLEYCKRKVNDQGVVASDADELENRFPSGTANLCTSSLYYDALLSAAALSRELGKPASLASDYEARAKTLRVAIEKYFGTNVEGFATYRYFDKSQPSVNARARQRHAHYINEPDHLRAWICIPLTVGIYDRAKGTVDALFSPKLWTVDGLATEAGKQDFWDRSTLYALRGVFAAGETERALEHLDAYSSRRLLGEHVPYAVEAYPEGNQAHLSAESALYCRIYTEGLFGMRPTGLHSFNCTPRLPQEWQTMSLKKVHGFGTNFDLNVRRLPNDKKLEVQTVVDSKTIQRTTIEPGETVTVKF